MTVSSASRIALFIDGANLYATAKALGFDIDYKRLLKEFQSHGTLVRAFYYTAVIEDQEFSAVRPLLDWLDYNGFTVVTKPAKDLPMPTAIGKSKATWTSNWLSMRWNLPSTSIKSCCFLAMAIFVRWWQRCSAVVSGLPWYRRFRASRR